MDGKKSVPLIYNPKPEKCQIDYNISRQFTRTLIKRVVNPDIRSEMHPAQNLCRVQIGYLTMEDRLAAAREKQKTVRKNLDQQWANLETKEKTLRDEFLKFNKFIRENIEKRDRAGKRMVEETSQRLKREKEVDALQQKFDELMTFKIMMDEKTSKYRMYQDYLYNFTTKYPDYQHVQEVLNKYYTLNGSKKIIAEKHEQDLDTLGFAKDQMFKLIEEKTFIIMGLNTQIASLQTRFENANRKALNSEHLLTQIKNNAVKKLVEYDQVCNSIWTICNQMAKNKGHTFEIPKADIERQMIYVKRALTELAKVNKIISRRLIVKQ